MSLAEYYRLSPQERAGWAMHLRRYPPGDFLSQSILAAIWAMLARVFGNKEAEPSMIAPWLDDPEERLRRADRSQRAFVYKQLQALQDAEDG